MAAESKQVAVIGLGRFGMALCYELNQQGAEVLAIDINEDLVRKAADHVTQAIVADCSIEDTVSELKLDDYDIAMVAIGDNVNASILTTLILKESGVKQVWVKAKDRYHAKILHKIGADRVVMPETEMGQRIARIMLDTRIFHYLELGSGLAIAEVVVLTTMMGHPLSSHPCCQGQHTQLLALKRGPELRPQPAKDTRMEIGDILIIAGPESELSELFKRI
ncbi:potassium channel family protein [Photobacterium salinisoli]|uniref:potassium channel family protein n=1 Tax=Photobacterium salinisoli TaxID=1616783 RepID=UPI000EA3126E|nr:TrkA family potassium uptake protein [Photobacterium salinisoli]